jgi:hypothetical protein
VNFKYAKQSGGLVNLLMLSLHLNQAGSGIYFENKIIGGAIPKNSSLRFKRRNEAAVGVFAGIRLDMKSCSMVHSMKLPGEMAFKMAGSLQRGVRRVLCPA